MSWPKPFARPGAGYEGVALGDHYALRSPTYAGAEVAKLINAAFEQHTRTLVAGYRELWGIVQALRAAWGQSHMPRVLRDRIEHTDHLDPDVLDLPEYVPTDWLCGAAMAMGMAEGYATRQLRVIEMALEQNGLVPEVREFARACILQNEVLLLDTKEKHDRLERELRAALVKAQTAPGVDLSPAMGGLLHTLAPYAPVAPIPPAEAAGQLGQLVGSVPCPTCTGTGNHNVFQGPGGQGTCRNCAGTGFVRQYTSPATPIP